MCVYADDVCLERNSVLGCLASNLRPIVGFSGIWHYLSARVICGWLLKCVGEVERGP
jgi:hypothetical protein